QLSACQSDQKQCGLGYTFGLQHGASGGLLKFCMEGIDSHMEHLYSAHSPNLRLHNPILNIGLYVDFGTYLCRVLEALLTVLFGHYGRQP
ncbi:MAG: hypothetical protein AAGF24_09635, partial [Cyanobacteria bacterium P01_H01_bin.121]